MNIFNLISYFSFVIIIAYLFYYFQIYNYYFEVELIKHSEQLQTTKNQNSLETYTAHSLFNVKVFTNELEPSCYMIIINPQRYNFFIENGLIMYHPSKKFISDAILKQYCCKPSDQYELVYVMPLKYQHHNHYKQNNPPNPRVLCHRNLSYLVTNIYTKEIYSHNYSEFQQPMIVISHVLKKLVQLGTINNLIL